jgi:putative toxin-antitoxin system antitoxin component (TIGR02293 family)
MGSVVMEKLGGYRVFRRRFRSDLEMDSAIKAGLPVKALDTLLGDLVGEFVSQADVYGVVGSARTLQRKRSQGTTLSAEESDRLARLARMVVRTEEALGHADRVQPWLAAPNRALGGRTPISLLGSDAGTLAVERVLGRIEHGIVS